jgi:fatty-acyl-CoA synthase
MTTFAEIVRARAGDQRTALTFEGQTFTWDAVIREASTRAAALEALPLAPGRTQRHVALLLQNVPDFIFWLLAAGLSGDVVIGANPTRKGAELIDDLSHADCDLLITERLYTQDLAGLALPFPPERVFEVESEAYREWLAAFEGAAFPELPDPAAIALLMFTSGSTGAPKAVICSQRRLATLAVQLTERVSIRPDSVLYLSMPLFHGNSIMMVLDTALASGASIVMVRRFSASGFVRDLHEHRFTFMNYVGRTINYILATPTDERDATSSLEIAFGTEASPLDRTRFATRFGCEVREGYGQSEGILRINPDANTPPNAMGRPVGDVVVEIRQQDGTVCPPARFDASGLLLNADEATGEIVCVGRGHLFEGYYRNPQAMADRLRGEGRDFWTGDLAYRDEQGYIYYAGRSSEWVRVGGENFSTAPVERILSRHEALAGVLAYAVPDPETGDQLMCTFQLDDGVTVDIDEFATWMKHQPDLGKLWRPRFIRLVDALPLTANGKVNKAPLRKQAWETSDPVWWLRPREERYRIMTVDDRTRLRQQLYDNGRINLAPPLLAVTS